MQSWVGPVALYMLRGLELTAILAVVCSCASVLLGMLLGSALVAKPPFVRATVRLFVELWRGLPLIVILFAIFFGLPAFGLRLGASAAAGVGLSLWGSAVIADNVRGVIQSIPAGQLEAARALGLSWMKAMLLVILPQAIRRLLPPTLNLVTSLIHGTSLAAQLGALELLESGRRLIQRLLLSVGDGHSLAIFGAVLVVYFCICYPLVLGSRWLERRQQAG